MRLSMISWIIKTSCLCYLPKPKALIIHDIMRKPNSIIVLSYIFHIIHPQKQKRNVWSCFWGEHSKALSNQTDVELDMINAMSAADIAFIMSSSQAIVNWLNALDQSDFFIVSLMYNNTISPSVLNCASLPRTIFASLARKWARARKQRKKVPSS